MAINPFQTIAPNKRFFVNEPETLLEFSATPGQSSLGYAQHPKDSLIQSVTKLVRDCPPSLPWASPFIHKGVHRGLFSGPTSIAYLFLTLHAKYPDLMVEGSSPKQWCSRYLELGNDSVLPLLNESCGINNEYLTFNAVRACLFRDRSYAIKVLDALRNLETDPTYCEWMKGRAGALYILRIIRHWLPEMKEEINVIIKSLIKDMLPQQPWVWMGRLYLGPVHGEIGIVTQIVLSDPSYAPQLEDKLLSLMKLQGEEGNWPVIEGKEIGLVQFCHGAPGFILSLLAIRSYFPKLHSEIGASIALGRRVIWKKGLLTKEPNICHGITGNALALETAERNHFLCLATPERIDHGITEGVFEKDADPVGLLWGEAGRAWVWMAVSSGEEGRLILYTDV